MIYIYQFVFNSLYKIFLDQFYQYGGDNRNLKISINDLSQRQRSSLAGKIISRDQEQHAVPAEFFFVDMAHVNLRVPGPNAAAELQRKGADVGRWLPGKKDS